MNIIFKSVYLQKGNNCIYAGRNNPQKNHWLFLKNISLIISPKIFLKKIVQPIYFCNIISTLIESEFHYSNNLQNLNY